jgi:hypothetical protein
LKDSFATKKLNMELEEIFGLFLKGCLSFSLKGQITFSIKNNNYNDVN